MLDVLEQPDIRRRVAPITIERYHRMIELGVFEVWPVELIHGVLVEKMSKSELHVYLVRWLFRALMDFCGEAEFLVGKEDPLTIGDSEPEPDLSVVRGSLQSFRHAKPATAQFVIEVAISSLVLDRAKAAIYAEGGVPETWIVVPEENRTEVFRHPVDGVYTETFEVPGETVVESSALPGFTFSLAEALAE